jgi:hypothetical protein
MIFVGLDFFEWTPDFVGLPQTIARFAAPQDSA